MNGEGLVRGVKGQCECSREEAMNGKGKERLMTDWRNGIRMLPISNPIPIPSSNEEGMFLAV